jgi:hypothetical protein
MAKKAKWRSNQLQPKGDSRMKKKKKSRAISQEKLGRRASPDGVGKTALSADVPLRQKRLSMKGLVNRVWRRIAATRWTNGGRNIEDHVDQRVANRRKWPMALKLAYLALHPATGGGRRSFLPLTPLKTLSLNLAHHARVMATIRRDGGGACRVAPCVAHIGQLSA